MVSLYGLLFILSGVSSSALKRSGACICVRSDEMGKRGWRESSGELEMWRGKRGRFSFEIKIYSEHMCTHTHTHTLRKHLQRWKGKEDRKLTLYKTKPVNSWPCALWEIENKISLQGSTKGHSYSYYYYPCYKHNNSALWTSIMCKNGRMTTLKNIEKDE